MSHSDTAYIIAIPLSIIFGTNHFALYGHRLTSFLAHLLRGENPLPDMSQDHLITKLIKWFVSLVGAATSGGIIAVGALIEFYKFLNEDPENPADPANPSIVLLCVFAGSSLINMFENFATEGIELLALGHEEKHHAMQASHVKGIYSIYSIKEFLKDILQMALIIDIKISVEWCQTELDREKIFTLYGFSALAGGFPEVAFNFFKERKFQPSEFFILGVSTILTIFIGGFFQECWGNYLHKKGYDEQMSLHQAEILGAIVGALSFAISKRFFMKGCMFALSLMSVVFPCCNNQDEFAEELNELAVLTPSAPSIQERNYGSVIRYGVFSSDYSDDDNAIVRHSSKPFKH
jgi:hypothetical protein